MRFILSSRKSRILVSIGVALACLTLRALAPHASPARVIPDIAALPQDAASTQQRLVRAKSLPLYFERNDGHRTRACVTSRARLVRPSS